ncbi:MAG TPA: ferric reductase-like transmembrane domain-containing protein, partial [Acidimicrobiales bacterium]
MAGLSRAGREVAVAVPLAALGLVVVAMWWHDTPAGSLRSWAARLTAAGDVTALVGTYLVLVQIVLIARIPWLERLLGMDRLAVWHRRNGQYSISLLVAHAFLTVWGYALADRSGPVSETTKVVLHYPDVLAGTVGLGLLVAVAVTSVRAARRRLPYQTWYFIHLYTYLAIALSFAHQLATGTDFATHPANRAIWVAMYVLTFALLVAYRVAAPLRRFAIHQLRVAGVTRESPEVVSVYITGKRLADLRAEPGQFFLWRFLTRDGWWQAHPYSLSAAPNPDWLRITVKAVGDHSQSVAGLQPGTRVMAEGPYGAFTARRRTRRRVALIAGGIGITPLRALIETLPARKGDLALLYRVSCPEHRLFTDELEEIAARRGAVLRYLVGTREELPDALSPRRLRAAVPDIVERDVYVCGPPGMVAATRASLEALGV